MGVAAFKFPCGLHLKISAEDGKGRERLLVDSNMPIGGGHIEICSPEQETKLAQLALVGNREKTEVDGSSRSS